MSIQATFKSMGLRAEKAVATHILLENAYESNLVPDISKVDYLEGNIGRTHLQPLDGLPTFVDDIYVFGYLRREDCIVTGRSTSCTTGDNGSAKLVVADISTAVRKSLGTYQDGNPRWNIHTAIAHTVATNSTSAYGIIRATVARIESDTNYTALKKWREIYPGAVAAAIFVAKVDVSEIPMAELQASLPGLARQLLSFGYDIYCIDYTQDFSGVLDRTALVEHLCAHHWFRKHGDLATAIGDDTPTILDNTSSVGQHVCTWVRSREDGYTTRTTIYNKVVSNFEAGEIREQFGGHLADYADCPNRHLRETFLHPDTQARGCTRIEVSLYACRGHALSEETAKEILQETLDLVSPVAGGLFLVQPPAKQWEKLAACLDRCLVLADRPQGEIYVAWYAHTTTGRISGIRIRPTKENVDNDATWERAVRWAAADFGFRTCPIFRLDILGAKAKTGVELAPLRCYKKGKEAQTVLADSKKPTALHPYGQDLQVMLPETPTISWTWRKSKCHAIGVETSPFELEELPQIAQERAVSLLSTRDREKRLLQIQYAASAEAWRCHMRVWQEADLQMRAAHFESLRQYADTIKKYREKSKQTFDLVELALRKDTQRLSSMVGRLKILGYKRQEQATTRIVVRKVDETAATTIWPTKALKRVLAIHEKSFEKRVDKYKCTTFWLLNKLEIDVYPSRIFYKERGQSIIWHKIHVVLTPNPEKLAILQQIASIADKQALRLDKPEDTLEQVSQPKAKDTSKAIYLLPGEYMCRRFSVVPFRSKQRVVLFLLPTDANGEPTTDVETPVYGHFLALEVERLGGSTELKKMRSPMRCRLGDIRTTPQKKKARLVVLAAIGK